jgi:undecaprenyl-diphosphatase
MSSQQADSTARHAVHRRALLAVAGLLVLAIAFGVLCVLAASVLYFPIDLTISRDVQAWQQPWLVALFGAVSWIGFPPQSNVEFGFIILALALVGRRLEAGVALFAAAGSAGLWFLIAPLVHRPRPSPDLVHVAQAIPWGSFPSGHVLNLTAFFGFLVFLAWTQLRPSAIRTLVLVVCGGLVALIGPARIYSGEHWPSDVLGGYMLGGLWLAITIHLYRRGQQHPPV